MFVVFTKGGPIMYVLLACSILSLAIIMERVSFWLAIRRQRDENAVRAILSSVHNGNLESAIQIARRSKDFVAGITKRSIAFYQEVGSVPSEGLAEVALAEEMPRMRRYLDILDTIVTTAPLLGILGTVVGIINAFGFLGPSGGDPRAVSGGISVALLTTAAGLVVALLSLIPYNYFNSRTEEAMAEIEKTIFQLHLSLEGNGKK